MPSGILDGAFLVGLNIKVKFNAQEDELETDIGNFEGVSSGTLETYLALIAQLSTAATGFELAADDATRRLEPTKRLPATPLERLLTVLDARGGRATVDE